MVDEARGATAVTTGRHWLRRWWPSRRLRHDPLADVRIDDRYVPVSVANWKLTPWMRDAVLGLRKPHPLVFEPKQRLTIVIPFRDREQHLQTLLPVLTAKLAEQSIQHRILIVEQSDESLFNRGKLINIGVQHAAADSDYYCFHDVDAIPVVANYLCPSQPLRLVSSIRTANGDDRRTNYYFSGAVSVRKEQVIAANGFSNEYAGWGKEDDDFFFRLLLRGFLCYYDTRGVFGDLPNPRRQRVQRRPAHLSRNRARRSLLLRGLLDPQDEGLTTLRYEVLEHQRQVDHERLRVRW